MDTDRMEYVGSAEFGWLERFGGRIKEFKGEGELTLSDELVVPCAFDCVYLDDGRILAECDLFASVLELSTPLLSGLTGARLEGCTTEGLHILAEKATTQEVELSVGQDKPSKVLVGCPEVNVCRPVDSDVTPVRLAYGLANLEFLGDEVSEFEIEGRPRVSRDTFRFEVASIGIVVRQVTEYAQVVKRMKARRCLAVSAEAGLELTGDPAEVRSYDNMMDVVCTLLSLAKGSRVRWLYSKLTDQDGELYQMRMLSKPSRFWVDGGALIGGPTATGLKEFVAHSYDPYLQEQSRFNLPVAIGLYLASKSENLWNTRFLLACIAMETLKSNFARHGNHKASFGSVVKKMLAEYEIEYTEDDLYFINLRNEVVHEGELGKSFRETWGTYLNLICLLDKIFVNILGYGGEYLDYSKQWRLM